MFTESIAASTARRDRVRRDLHQVRWRLLAAQSDRCDDDLAEVLLREADAISRGGCEA